MKQLPGESSNFGLYADLCTAYKVKISIFRELALFWHNKHVVTTNAATTTHPILAPVWGEVMDPEYNKAEWNPLNSREWVTGDTIPEVFYTFLQHPRSSIIGRSVLNGLAVIFVINLGWAV